MKKWICLIAVLVMVFSLAACAAKTDDAAGSAPAEDAAAGEDTQNPAMNFMGRYGKDRCTIDVAVDGAEGTIVTVTWGSSAWETAEWTMSGKLDGETLVLDYNDAVKKIVTFAEDGSVAEETVEYENGTGSFTFAVAEDGTTTLTWDDAMEHIADETVFEYSGIVTE